MRRLNLKSKSVSPGRIELNYEVRLRDGDAGFVNVLGDHGGGGQRGAGLLQRGLHGVRPLIRHRRIDLICALAMALALVLTGAALRSGRLWASGAPPPHLGIPTASLTTAGSTRGPSGGGLGQFIADAPAEEYIPCTAVIDGEEFYQVGIRAKGNNSCG